MKSQIKTHPRYAPVISGLTAIAMTWFFSIFEDRSVISVAGESLVMGIAMYLLVKSQRDRPD